MGIRGGMPWDITWQPLENLSVLPMCTLQLIYINLYYNSVRSSVCMYVCMSVRELLLDQWTDLLHIWWKDAPHTRITPELHFMTLGQRSRSPWGSRSP